MKRYTRKNMTTRQVALLDHIHEETEKGNNPIPLECTRESGSPGWNLCTPESLDRKNLIRIVYVAPGVINIYPSSQGIEVAKRLYEQKSTDVSFLAHGEEKPKTYIDVVSENGTVRFYVGANTIKDISSKLIGPAFSIETF